MVQKASTPLSFLPAWTFPEKVEKRIAAFVDSHPSLWLHAPVGISQLGKGIFATKTKIITLDINEKLKPDIVCDIFKMTEHPEIQKILKYSGGFDGVISDPLWYSKEKKRSIGLSYHQRRYLSYQVRDVLKPNGLWLFNGLWNPRVKGMTWAEGPNPYKLPVEVPMQAFSSFRNVSLLVYMRKANEFLFETSNTS